MTPSPQSRPRVRERAPGEALAAIVSVAVGVAAFALYLWLAPPVSGDRDSSEFTLVLALDGVAHPTGYVLWSALGHVFARLAHGFGLAWPQAANAWSALGGGVAVAFLHALAWRLAAAEPGAGPALRHAAALLPVLAFALNPAWTQGTMVAEVYAWHLAWALALATVFVDAAARGAAGTASARAALGWGLLCGAGLAHHATSTLIVVPLTLVLASARRPAPAVIAPFVLGATALPLLSLVLLRVKLTHFGPAHWGTLEPSWASAWAHVTGAQYLGRFGTFAPEPMDRALVERHVFPLLAAGGAALSAAWALAAGERAKSVLLTLMAAFVLQALFAFGYGVEDPSAYFVPALALGAAAFAAVPGALAARGGSLAALARVVVVLGALACGTTVEPGLRTARIVRETFVGLDAFVHEQWMQVPIERGFVLWPRDMHARLREYQLLRGEKPALEVWNPRTFTHPAVRRRFFARHGFDPLGDLTLRREDLLAGAGASEGSRRFAATVGARIAERSGQPVVLFEPEVPRITLLPAGTGAR